MTAVEVAAEESRIFIGRQPIFDTRRKLYAYELLFRSGDCDHAILSDGNQASSRVIYNAMMEVGLDDLVGSRLAFINFTSDLLANNIAELLPPDKVVIEVLENVRVDRKVVENVRALASRGFTIALDDFVYSPDWRPLLEVAGIVKLDVLDCSQEEITRQLGALAPYPVRLLAEKVETGCVRDQCQQMGFELFQGYFFARPELVRRKKLPDNHVALLQLLSRLQDPHIEIEEVEALVSRTVSLSYKLFRFVNSAFFGLPRKFDSISQVLVYFGLGKLKELACLIALAGVDESSSEIVTLGLTRARMSESLAEATNQPDKSSYFVTGLFSILEALLRYPFDEIVERLPLTEEVVAALRYQDGLLGEALQCCLACENADLERIRFTGLAPETIYQLYEDAMVWSRQAASVF